MNKHVAVRRFGISILLAGAALLTSVAFSSAASADDTKGNVTAPKTTPVTKTSFTPRFDHIEHHAPVILRQAGRAGDRVVRSFRSSESSRAPAAATRRDAR